jgi:SIR2-like domain
MLNSSDASFTDPPFSLIEAARSKNLILFIGAGVSRLAGCPGWDDFADKSLEALLSDRIINYCDFEQLKKLSPRTKASIARILEKENGSNIDYRGILKPRQRDTEDRIYKVLEEISTAFITTNYDICLDERRKTDNLDKTCLNIPNKKIYCPRDGFDIDHLVNNQEVVIHLHGSTENPAHMIVSTKEYIEHYLPNNHVSKFLKQLFSHPDKRLLFIGYGLEELELLEYMVFKSKTDSKAGNSDLESRHFILVDFFKHQLKLMELLRSYFKEFGIFLIPYFKDEKGYDGLIDFIERLRDKILYPIEDKLALERLADEL